MNSWRIALFLFAGCAPYQSEAVFQTMEGSHRFECLDLHVGPALNRARSWVVMRYTFGNPCRTATPIDLSAVRVRAMHGDEGSRLPAFDPREELHPGELDGGMRGEELIAYEIPSSLVGEDLHVCVMLGDVAQPLEDLAPYCFDWESP